MLAIQYLKINPIESKITISCLAETIVMKSLQFDRWRCFETSSLVRKAIDLLDRTFYLLELFSRPSTTSILGKLNRNLNRESSGSQRPIVLWIRLKLDPKVWKSQVKTPNCPQAGCLLGWQTRLGN